MATEFAGDYAGLFNIDREVLLSPANVLLAACLKTPQADVSSPAFTAGRDLIKYDLRTLYIVPLFAVRGVVSVIEDYSQLLWWGIAGSTYDLLCVVQLFPQFFYYQTNKAIGDGICDQNLIEPNRVMHARYCNRACYADNGPNIAHALAGRWKGRYGKECPKSCE